VLRYRAPRALLQLSYTLGHTIDNQSEPLAGDYFNLGFTQGSQPAVRQSTFTRQFDSSADRGDSDFDQRQNLAFFSTWDLPAFYSGSRAAPLWNGWRFALLGAIRAGLPFTVYAPTSFDPLPDNRANLKNPDLVAADQPAPGGRLLLNSTAFERAARNVVGNSGRNAFRGPGFFSLDLSLARSFPFRSLGDGGRLTLRADAYNLLNHANLNSPQSNLNFGRFGVGLYGLEGRSTGFPGETPFRETARQIQLLLRVEF
jgi:hypothetical protein